LQALGRHREAPGVKLLHPALKPPALMTALVGTFIARAIESHVSPDWTVYGLEQVAVLVGLAGSVAEVLAA